jgi:hypothetical protein
MSEATNRRAILGAIVTAGAAIGLPAALATAAAAAPTLSPVDKRVEHLWLRRRRLKAIAGHLNKQHKAAADSLPAWAQAGPDLVFGDGTPAGGKASSGWPQVADLSRRPAFPSGAVNGRPAVNDIVTEWHENSGTKADLARALIEWGGRVLEQETESERAGLDEYSERLDHAWGLIHDVEDALRAHIGESMFALAAVLVVENGVADEDVPGLLRATLAVIRPQISGPIAEDADRALAERDEDGGAAAQEA